MVNLHLEGNNIKVQPWHFAEYRRVASVGGLLAASERLPSDHIGKRVLPGVHLAELSQQRIRDTAPTEASGR